MTSFVSRSSWDCELTSKQMKSFVKASRPMSESRKSDQSTWIVPDLDQEDTTIRVLSFWYGVSRSLGW